MYKRNSLCNAKISWFWTDIQWSDLFSQYIRSHIFYNELNENQNRIQVCRKPDPNSCLPKKNNPDSWLWFSPAWLHVDICELRRCWRAPPSAPPTPPATDAGSHLDNAWGCRCGYVFRCFGQSVTKMAFLSVYTENSSLKSYYNTVFWKSSDHDPIFEKIDS